jgi:hypothetical protein
MKVQLRKFYLATLYSPEFMSGRKYDAIPQNATVQENAMCVLLFVETKSVIKTQRRYRPQHGKESPSDNAIRRWLKQFQETGNILHRKEREDRALRRKMSIEYRKGFLEVHKNQLEELLCS